MKTGVTRQPGSYKLTFLRSLLILAGAFVSQSNPRCAWAQSSDTYRVYDIDSDTGLDLARGFDILTTTPRNQCVVVQTTIDHPEYGFNGVQFRSFRVESSQQLDRMIGLSATASINVGVGRGSASASYLDSLNVNNYSINYAVEATVTHKGKSVQVQELQERYKKLLSSGNPDLYRRFRSICGDGYITEMPIGGSFRALVQIQTHSRDDAQRLSASLGGSYSAFSASASFSSAIREIAKDNEVRIWSFRRGGDGPVPITVDDIATSAANLPIAVKQAPTPIQIAVMSYVSALDDPALPVATLSQRAGQVERLATLSQKARDQISDARFILNHPDQFQGQSTDALSLSNEIATLNVFREAVSTRADSCISADGVCLIDDLIGPSPLARPARR